MYIINVYYHVHLATIQYLNIWICYYFIVLVHFTAKDLVIICFGPLHEETNLYNWKTQYILMLSFTL